MGITRLVGGMMGLKVVSNRASALVSFFTWAIKMGKFQKRLEFTNGVGVH